MIGHYNVLVTVLVEPAVEVCGVICEEIKVSAYGEETALEELSVKVVEVYSSDVVNSYCEINGCFIVSDVIRVNEVNDLVYIRLVTGISCGNLVYNLPEDICHGNSMCTGVVEVTLGIAEGVVSILVVEYGNKGIVHILIGNCVCSLINNLVDILHSKVEVALVLIYKRDKLALSKLGEVDVLTYVLLDNVDSEEVIVINSCDEGLQILNGEAVQKGVNIISVSVECIEYLLLKAIGKSVALCCLEHKCRKLIGNMKINVKNAVYIANVNVVSDDACNSSDLIVAAADLTGKCECYVTESGVNSDIVGELHLAVLHISDIVGLGKIKEKILDCSEIDAVLSVSIVKRLAVNGYALDGCDKLYRNVTRAKVTYERLNFELGHKFILSILNERIVSAGNDSLNGINVKLCRKSSVVSSVRFDYFNDRRIRSFKIKTVDVVKNLRVS